MPCTSDKPRPVPTPYFLRREKWIEDAVEHVGRDAAAVVADFQHDVGADPIVPMVADRSDVEVDRFERDRQGSARGHRLHGVRAEVHQHLMHLRGITQHRCLT